MKNSNENSEYTVIPDSKIDYGVRPKWTRSPGPLSRWATTLLGLKPRSSITEKIDQTECACRNF